MCHIGQTFSESCTVFFRSTQLTSCAVLIGSIQHGSCTLQPTKINFSTEELVDMIKRCRLNRLHQFAAFLSVHLRHAAQNQKVLVLLKSLDIVYSSGMPMPKDDEEFAYRAGVPLIVSICHYHYQYCNEQCCLAEPLRKY